MVREQFADMLSKLTCARDAYEAELSTLAEGKLRCSKDSYGVRFYQVTRENDKVKRKGIGKNRELVNELARKAYLERAISILDKNIAMLKKGNDAYEPCDPDAIVNKLSATYQSLDRKVFFNPLADIVALDLDREEAAKIASHANWGSEQYEVSDYMPEGRKILTSRGERMRSKAEVLIAEKLYEFGIPFRYEQELILDGTLLHPDFTFEGAGAELFYLEFCGMMDNPSYVNTFLHKRAVYESAGIYEWKNMIYVYASDNDMNMMHVENLIRTRVIPWL